MFRLLKLIALGLLGYALYEFYQGLVSGVQAAPAEGGQPQGGSGGMKPGLFGGNPAAGHERQEVQPGDAGNGGAGNMQFSGPGEGRRVQTEEASGEGVPHIVGRGVVH
jgi:hypothetical protein